MARWVPRAGAKPVRGFRMSDDAFARFKAAVGDMGARSYEEAIMKLLDLYYTLSDSLKERDVDSIIEKIRYRFSRPPVEPLYYRP